MFRYGIINRRAIRAGFLALITLLMFPDNGSAQFRLPDTPANRARGVVGCIQTSTGIDCSNRTGTGTFGTSPGSALGGAIGSALAPTFFGLGYQIGCAFFGCPDPNAAMRDQSRRQELARQQEELAEQERLRQEAERRQREEFERARERMLGQMRGTEMAVLQPRDLTGSLRTLEVDPVRGPFGTTDLKPRDLETGTGSLRPRTIEGQRPLTTYERANCAAYLLQKANDATTIENFEEAAYLSNEAARLMNVSSGQPGVTCPQMTSGVPPVVGAPTPESRAAAEALRRRTVLYSTLLGRAAQQMSAYKSAATSVEEGTGKLGEARTQKENAERRKQEVEVQEPSPAKESALAEALAALRQAQAALEGAEKLLSERQQSLNQLENQLQATRSLAEEAGRHPDRTDALLQRLGVNVEPNPS